jgi:hypothetical protein
MILSRAYDVEVLPNFFSVVIIDVGDYLKVFSDCHDGSEKKKPIPLTQKFTVNEIKNKLTTINKKKFYITDTNDEQLLPMLGYLNDMRPHYGENNVAIRTDMYRIVGYTNACVSIFNTHII